MEGGRGGGREGGMRIGVSDLCFMGTRFLQCCIQPYVAELRLDRVRVQETPQALIDARDEYLPMCVCVCVFRVWFGVGAMCVCVCVFRVWFGVRAMCVCVCVFRVWFGVRV
jgi:hypothetical protein